MEILNLLVGRDDGIVQGYFGVEYESALWLVTAWLIHPNKRDATPERMIRVDIPGQNLKRGDPPFHYVNILLPRAVIEGLSEDTQGYEVRSLPDSPVVDARTLKPLPLLFSHKDSQP